MVRMNRAPDGATHTKVSLSFDYIADEETALLHHFQNFHVNPGQKMLLLITSTWTFQRFYYISVYFLHYQRSYCQKIIFTSERSDTL
ncbi:hypothetical protein T05_2629 [Trichinella murrelli]|uniref:Uncharacterized protein n=1 Tax=Trichinella murrelli TaxID=144512 RepID=A0A0V0TT21_9BILA|nr:hypothetical protein T05_2629 [Trichinella murrelli]